MIRIVLIGVLIFGQVGPVLYNDYNFRERMNKICWNRHMTPETFEKEWASLIVYFDLKDNKWFSDMYRIRQRWIPSYFKDLPMNGLMRTTSLSESENSFFGRCKNPKSTLVDFMMRFEGALDKQRHTQRLLEYEMENSTVKFLTRLNIEQHAHELFTPTSFILMQKEMEESIASCVQISCINEDGQDHCVIREKVADSRKKMEFKVINKLLVLYYSSIYFLFSLMNIIFIDEYNVRTNHSLILIDEYDV